MGGVKGYITRYGNTLGCCIGCQGYRCGTRSIASTLGHGVNSDSSCICSCGVIDRNVITRRISQDQRQTIFRQRCRYPGRTRRIVECLHRGIKITVGGAGRGEADGFCGGVVGCDGEGITSCSAKCQRNHIICVCCNARLIRHTINIRSNALGRICCGGGHGAATNVACNNNASTGRFRHH